MREESCSVDASDNLQLHPLGAVFLAAYGLSMLPWHLARPFSTCHLDWNEGELRGDEVKEDPFPLPSLTSPIPLMHHPIRQHLLCPSFIPNLRNRRCRIRLQSVVVELVQVWACLVDFWGCMSIERGFLSRSPRSRRQSRSRISQSIVACTPIVYPPPSKPTLPNLSEGCCR